MAASRSRLLSLLSEACELEHGLACSYLYSAFSLKQDVSEGGLDWRQLQQVRLWAAEIYVVAAEEMLHLAQAWNILAAVGGSPYYLRPNFPQRRTYYGFHQPLALEPFGFRALDRFIAYETPADRLPPRSPDAPKGSDDDPASFRSVGELYALISEQISDMPEGKLFFPGSQGEMGPEVAHFPQIIPVRCADDARAAIRLITEQGEGVPDDREDSHYGVFRRTRAALERSLSREPKFQPARAVLDNPVPRFRADW
ncbi:MAG TPA: ferritin-like domain-containing protein, partial [Chthoniobacterales bacterium]